MPVWFFNFKKKNKTRAERRLYQVYGVFIFIIFLFFGFCTCVVFAANQITQFNYYANNTNSFKMLLIDSSNVVQYKSDLITPLSVGVGSYTPASPVPYTVGWRIGVWSQSNSAIPFVSSGESMSYTSSGSGEPNVSSTITWAGSAGRTYSLNGENSGTIVIGNSATSRANIDHYTNFSIMDTNNNAVPSPTPWYNASWGYRTRITIDHTKVASTTGALLTNFPVLVSTTTTALKYTSFTGGHVGTTTGADILFTSADGTTALNYEIEKYASSTGELVAWVKIPSLATSTDTDIYLYYGNALASTPDTSVATGVWDDGGSNYFKGVWHLKEATGSNIIDSTANSITGTQYNSPTQTSGQIDGSITYNGSTQYNSGTISSGLAGSFTFSNWVNNSNNTASVPMSLESDVSSYGNYWASLGFYTTKWTFGLYDGTHNPYTQSTSNIGTGSWVYVAGVRDTQTGKIYLYVNGVLQGTGVTDTTTLVPVYSNFYVGAQISQPNRYFPGTIDEARVSSVARSADWIKTEYNNQSAPGSFAISASEEAVTVPGVPTGLTATAGNTQIGLSWTAPVNTGGIVLTDYVIDYKLNSTSTWSTYADGVSTSTTFTIIGLVNGTSYDFRISAVNALGQGSASATVIATPATIPGAPTIGVATAGNALASVAFTLLPSPSVAPWYNNSWIYRKKITIDKTKVPNTNQTNFPVLVSLTGLSNINTDGTDIRFTDSTGTTELAREIESYSAGTLVAWVKVPVLSTSANTDIYMYYGNPSETSEPSPSSTYGSQKVWDDGGSNYFKGVWHLANAGSSTSTDSTSYANNGTNHGATALAGKVAGGAGFNGSGQYITAGINPVTGTSTYTISAWVKSTANGTGMYGGAIGIGNGGSGQLAYIGWVDAAQQGTGSSLGGGGYGRNYGSGITDRTAFHHLVLTSTGGATQTVTLYTDGIQKVQHSESFNISSAGIKMGVLDDNGTLNYYLSGGTDEVRISNTTRSADWIATEYNNQSNPASFYAVAGEENVANSATNGGSAITAYTVTSNPGGFTSASTTSPIIVTGLTNGTPYTFTVTATNVMGTGQASASTAPVTPATVPGAPTAVTPTAGDRQVSLLWSAPASNGGSAITDYIIEYKLTSASDVPASWQIYSEPETPVISATIISGLINGTSYDFRITARNAIDSGSPSSPLVNSTPMTIPNAPTITSAVSGDMQVTVNFTPLPYPTVSSAGVWYNNSWTYRKKITIDKTKVPNTNQTNFPVLVSLTGLSNINASGTDIRFTSSDGTTELAREIESYSAGTLVAWVKVPVLSTSANTDIYMYYGNSSATSEPSPSSTYGSQKVWDEGGSNYFKGVWHLNDAGPTYVYDSTSAGSIGTQTGGVNFGVAGQIDRATNYDGSGDSIVTSSVAHNIGTGNFTWTVWVNPTSLSEDYRAVIANGAFSPGIYAKLSGGQFGLYWGTDKPSGATLIVGEWSHIVVKREGTTINFYINGSPTPTTYNISTSIGNTVLYMGQDGSPSREYLNGSIDEVRISSTARSADWIKTEYNNQSSPATFYAVAGEESLANSATNGGSEITAYTVTSDPESVVSSSSTSPIIVAGLTNGTPYTFTMTATNVVGQGPVSLASDSVTPAGVPGIPSDLTATPSNALVDLSWTAPANNGAEISNYVIEYKLHTAESWTQFGHPASPATTISVVDLVNGSLYDFRVSAYNSAGTGVPSDPTVSSTPRTVPGQPVITSVLRGNGQVTVGFTAPISDGGSVVTGYTVTSDPQGIIQTGTTSPIIVSGLTNGTPYTFTVTATNVAGTGPASTSSSPVTPATVPGKATAVTAVAGNEQATITFSEPLSNGGSTITGYTVTSNSGGTDSNAGSINLSHIVTGLTNGSTYTFTVVATNDVGDGLASDASSAITLPTAPTAPLNLAVEVKSSSIKLTWSNPASTGGSAITDYIIEYQLTTEGSWVPFDDGESVDKFATVTGLSNGTPYDFRVSAKNIIGTSTASDPASATPGEPAQVRIMGFPDLTNTSIGTDIRITNEGLIEYEYQYTYCVTDAVDNLCGGGDDVFSASNAKLIDAGDDYDFTATSTVATPGAYYFHISVAYGSVSSSAHSSFTAAATFPDPPTAVSAVAGNAEATVSFTAPASNGGTPITNYTVTSSPGGLTGTGLTTPILVTGLTNGTTYTFTMTATNIIGTGLSSSPPSNSVIPVSVPDTPSGVTAVAGNTSVVLSWIAPANDGGLDITDYVIEYKLTSEPSVWTVFADGVSPVTTVTITGLTNNMSYDFRISAVNALGRSGVNNTSATLPVTRSSNNTTGSRAYKPVTPVSPEVDVLPVQVPIVNIVPNTDTALPAQNIKTPAKSATTNTQPVEPSPIKNKNEITITPSENPPVLKSPVVIAESQGLGKWWYVIDFSGLILLGGFIFFIWRRLRGDIY